MKRETITLCGSTRFKKEFLETAKKLSLEGITVLMPSTFNHSEGKKLSEEQAREFDRIYINSSNGIYVIGVGGYVGESTKREIDYALASGKPVRYYSREMGARG